MTAESLPRLLSRRSPSATPALPAVERLSEVQAPTPIVVGERDHADNLKIASLLERGVPRARTVVLPGAGHLPMLELPEEFDRLLLGFLEGNASHTKLGPDLP